MSEPVTHPDIAPLAFLVGRWAGAGRGSYPTIQPFDYREVVTIEALPRPVLAYTQRTRSAVDDAPLHSESGFFRLPDSGPELTISQPTGIVEVYAGVLSGTTLSFTATGILATPSAGHHRVTGMRRELLVDGDVMTYQLWLAAAGQPLQVHLQATLRRQAG